MEHLPTQKRHRLIASKRSTFSRSMLLLSFFAAGFALVTILFDSEVTEQNVSFTICLFVAALFFIDRVGAWSSETFAEQEHNELIHKLNQQAEKLPSLITARHDIIIMPRSEQAVDYVNSKLEYTSTVRNTVLRFGSDAANSFSDEYQKALLGRMELIKTNNIEWYDIISIHSLKPLETFLSGLAGANSGYLYEYKLLDDRTVPMMQVMILSYNGDYGKEVLFGWEFANYKAAPVFVTKNPAIVSFFEKYFEHFYEHHAKDPSTALKELPTGLGSETAKPPAPAHHNDVKDTNISTPASSDGSHSPSSTS